MAKVLVKNAVDTVNDRPLCGCETWIEHWINNTGKNPSFCRNSNTDDHDEEIVGAHVKVLNSSRTFILPLCKKCNGKKENLPPFWVDGDDLYDANFCVYEIEKLLDSN